MTETKVCVECGKEKPIKKFLLRQNMDRMEQCADCYKKFVDAFFRYGTKKHD